MNSLDAYSAISNGRPAMSHSARMKQPKIKKVPECPVVENRNWLIQLHYSRKEFDICKIIIQEELQKSNGMCEYANFVLGLILRHEGKIQESLEYFQMCHTLSPRSVDNIKQVARSLFLLGRHRLAMEAYLEAESVMPKPDWDIYHNLGMCLLYLGDRMKAKEYLLRAIQLSRQQISYISLAKIHLLEEDMEGAIWVYKAALESYPDSSELATSLGLLYMRAEQYQQAFEQLGSALSHDANYPKALLAAGSMMQTHKDVDVALSKYKLAVQHLPESSALWNNIGMCFFEKKKFVAAISCLKRANYLAPFDYKALYNLGLVHFTTRQYASAFNFLSAAINVRPESGDAFHLLALVLKYLGDPDNAGRAFEQAAILRSGDATIPLNYSVFLNSIGKKDEAGVQHKRFETMAAGNSNADDEMKETSSKLKTILFSKPFDVKDFASDQNEDATHDSPPNEDDLV